MSRKSLFLPSWNKMKTWISLPNFKLSIAANDRLPYTFLSARGVAQLGSATALGAVGRWFESSHPDHFSFCFTLAAVVQLVEHQPSKLTVAGSSPVRRSIKFPILNYRLFKALFWIFIPPLVSSWVLVVFRRVSNFSTVISVFTDILLAIFFFTCHDQLLIY